MNNIEYTLQCLQEECAEIIHIASKCVRFSTNSADPRNGNINIDVLVDEIKDLYHKIEKLQELGILPSIELSSDDRTNRDSRFYKYKAIHDSIIKS